MLWDGVKVVVKKLIHHQHRTIGNLRGPVVNVLNEAFNDVLGSNYSWKIMVWFAKEAFEPFFTTEGFCEIEFMENRELFFQVKYGYIVESRFVYLHVKGR